MRSGVQNPIIPMGRQSGSDQGRFLTLDTSYFGLTVAGSTATIAPIGDLLALEQLNSNGIAVRTGASTWALRTITGTSDRVSVSSGDGVAGNPTLDIAATYVGQTSITTLGTIATGTWQGTTIGTGYGGTGVTGTASNGQLLIGNGSGYTVAALTAGAGISITNGSGSITIANSGVTSLTGSTGVGVSASTGAVTLSNTGVTSLAGTTNQVSVSAATGAITISLPQNINSGAAPTFAGTNFTGIPNGALSNSSLTVTAGTGMSGGGAVSLGGSVTLNNAGVTSLTGTSNQITVSGSTGSVTLSTPQNIHTGASPTFAGMTLSGKLSRSNGNFSANGTTQGAGTNLTKDINFVTSASSGSAEAVRLPTGAAGDEIIVTNETAVNVYIFPQNSCAIGGLGNNNAFTAPAGSAFTFIATSATQWRVLNAAYA